MEYELTALDELVEVTLNPQNIENISESQFKSWQSFSLTEKKHIRELLILEVFTLPDQRQVELYIQRHQAAIIHLADILLNYIKETSKWGNKKQTSSLNNLYRQLCTDLVALLTFIEDHFSCCYNQDLNIPLSYRILSQQDLKEKLKIVEHQFQFITIDDGLLDIVLQPIREIVDKSHTTFNFRHLRFCKTLADELILLSNDQSGENKTLSLQAILYYLNFNSSDYLNYYTQVVSKELETISQLPQKQEKLAYYIKLLYQGQVKPDFALYPQMPTLTYSLLNWLQEEYEFLETKQQLNPPYRSHYKPM